MSIVSVFMLSIEKKNFLTITNSWVLESLISI